MDPQKIAEKMQELREGQLPSNPEIISTLENVKQAQAEVQGELSPTGQQLSQDITQIVEDVQKIVEQKNPTEALQEAVKETMEAARVSTTATTTGEIGEEAKEVGMNLVKVANMFITSASFRKALGDFFAIGQKHCTVFGEYFTSGSVSSATETTKDPYSTIGHSAYEKHQSAEGSAASTSMGTMTEAAPITFTEATISSMVSEEEQNKLGQDFYQLMTELQEHEEYQQAIGFLSSQIAALHESMKEQRQISEEFTRAGKACQKMLENWFDLSLDPMIRRLTDLNRRIRENDKILNEWEQLGHFVKNCLMEQGYLTDSKWIKEEAKERFYSLHEALQKDQKQVTMVRELIDDWNYLLERANRDETLQKLGHDLTDLYSHLLKDAQGRPAFKPELIRDLRTVLPSVLRRLQYIKMPDLLVDDPKGGYAMTIQNALVNVSELAPRQITLSFELGEEENRLAFRLKGVNADVKGLKYTLDKRIGFPHWQDTGLADIRIHGLGMDLLIILAPTNYQVAEPKEQVRYGIIIQQVKCIIHHLDLNLYETQHDWVYTVFGPWVRSALRVRLERMIEEYLEGTDLSVSAETIESLKENIPVM